MGKTKQAFIWSAAGKFTQYLTTFILGIFTARILSPDDYGLLGVLAIFTIVSTLLIDSGFKDALIREEHVNSIEYSSVFYFNISVSVILYILLFFLAPFIASFYQKPILTTLARWLFLSFIINSLSIIQTAIHVKSLNFKFLAKVNIFSGIISGGLALLLAVNGFGIWSLLIANLSNYFNRTLILWIYSPWRPCLVYKHDVIKKFFPFSIRLLGSGLLSHICANLSQLVIGKFFSVSDVGYYDRALTLQRVPMTTASDVINEVSYPLISNQKDLVAKKKIFFNLLSVSIYVLIPLFIFLIVISKPLILLLLTDKWEKVIPLFQILCIDALLYPISVLNNCVIKGLGLSKLIFRNEIIRNVILLSVIFVCYQFGVFYFVFGIAVSNMIISFFYSFTLEQKTHWGNFIFQLKNVAIAILLSVSSALIMMSCSLLITDNSLLLIIFQLLVGFLFYLLLLYMFKRSFIRLLLDLKSSI